MELRRLDPDDPRPRFSCGDPELDEFYAVDSVVGSRDWFTVGNKTGCRFLIVDAYNRSEAVSFYRRNGFEFLTSSDEADSTRIMYFDLITFRL